MARSNFDRDVPGRFGRDDRGYGGRYADERASRDDRSRDDRGRDDRRLDDRNRDDRSPSRGNDRYDRGPGARIGDEVRSWFGDEEAERRRAMDDIRDYNPSYSPQYDDRDHARYGWWGGGRVEERGNEQAGNRRPWSDYRSVDDRRSAGDYGSPGGYRGSESHRQTGEYRGERPTDDRGSWERPGRRFDGVTRSDFDQSRYSNPRDEWSERDRGYERVYRAEHGRQSGPGEYARSQNAPWSTHGTGGAGDLGRGDRSGVEGRRGWDARADGNVRDERGAFERAGDEVRSWFGDDEAERRRREDARRDRRPGDRFDDHPATDRSSDRWW